MNKQVDLCDEKFVSFLQSLGVETYKKSFEWMFDEPDFAGILLWLYNNLDHNNALSAREKYRYVFYNVIFSKTLVPRVIGETSKLLKVVPIRKKSRNLWFKMCKNNFPEVSSLYLIIYKADYTKLRVKMRHKRVTIKFS